jgi:hypothetical protein
VSGCSRGAGREIKFELLLNHGSLPGFLILFKASWP